MTQVLSGAGAVSRPHSGHAIAAVTGRAFMSPQVRNDCAGAKFRRLGSRSSGHRAGAENAGRPHEKFRPAADVVIGTAPSDPFRNAAMCSHVRRALRIRMPEPGWTRSLRSCNRFSSAGRSSVCYLRNEACQLSTTASSRCALSSTGITKSSRCRSRVASESVPTFKLLNRSSGI